MLTGNEIREKFLRYFERHGHTRVRSSPLLPANDPTLLFTNAGMNQFKDVFLGLEKRDCMRACSSQKCLRAGGRHNDLDEVGKTARHQTFFEMLGNFSFGDYFKEDAIKFAWDLLVNEYKLDPARMWFSVFEGDDEVGPDEDAEKFWAQVGAPKERILRFGRKDNFWQMADTGPCGPCSEIHYYMGDDPRDVENCAANVNGPGDTITELWNLVFMQFERTEIHPGEYSLTPLPAPSVDTGMGLERLTVVLQGVKSNYETDLLKDIVEFVARLSGRKYEAETPQGFAMRVIADHARATAFSIADGILPANEGRNYVLRKIMRRAIYQGRHALGFEDLFFHKVTNFVVDQVGEAYPELEASRDFIKKIVKLEEERFTSTLTTGLEKLDSEELTKAIADLRSSESLSELDRKYNRLIHKLEHSEDEEWFADIQPADEVWNSSITVLRTVPEWEKQFRDSGVRITDLTELQKAYEETSKTLAGLLKPFAKLYDTYGIPRDLIRVALEERGFSIDEDSFNKCFDIALREVQPKNVEISVTATATPSIGINVIKGPYSLAAEEFGPVKFVGYETTR